MPDIEQPTLIQRSDGLLLREIREDKREADFVASTEALDSHGTIIEQNWELDRFRANPVILYAHQSRELPIGQATRIEVKDGKLEVTIKFATEKANPKAEHVWQSVNERTLRGVSVGFWPLDYAWEKRDGREILVFKRQELFEISVTPVPSNPEALAKLKARAMAARSAGEEPAKQEKSMPEQAKQDESAIRALKDEKAALETRVQTLEGQNRALEEKNKVLESQNKHLVEERDAAIKRAEEADAKLIDREVDDLVGRKITAAEKDQFVRLRKLDPELFKQMVEQRRDLKLDEAVTQQASVSTPEGKAPESPTRGDDLDDVVAEMNKALDA